MSNSLSIEIKGLTKSYGTVQALRGVDLSVKCGEILGFLGPNGAGKTTTIRCLLDLIRPQAGTMRILGIDPAKDPVAVRSRVGYLPGELNLESNLTVKGALHYFNDLRKRKADWNYVRELTERLELDLDKPIKNLSKGNKQKVGLVQALMTRPELLLLDEPTSGLDPLMQQEVYHLLREAKDNGTTVFFSSHVISEVETIAERVAIIRSGVIVEEAEPGKLINMSLRRYRLRFREPVNIKPVISLEGISLIRENNGTDFTIQVEGEVDRLVKALAKFPVSDLQSDHLSLEEVFLAYYKAGKKEENEYAGRV
ncbi:MAG: ABC transporter ATP-binding protein [Bacillota bacterium]|nr:ABC transporter ATP-binding protein [Bacillota bacterium]MDW7683575.1 ABC transporter ATP-binding protein [Bacillota bacterium]